MLIRFLILYCLLGLPAYRMTLRRVLSGENGEYVVTDWVDVAIVGGIALVMTLLFGVFVWPYVYAARQARRNFGRSASPREFVYLVAGENEAERTRRRRRAAERRDVGLRDVERRIL